MINLTGQAQATDTLSPMPGMTWALLSAERQETCAALLSPQPGLKRLEALQMKLGRIDRAMDQLIEGRYGLCRVCGGAIERKLLAADNYRE